MYTADVGMHGAPAGSYSEILELAFLILKIDDQGTDQDDEQLSCQVWKMDIKLDLLARYVV